MDSMKPRVSISASRVVDPRAYIHARTLSGSSSTGSVPIRAPLTLDDDADDGDDEEEYNSDFEFNGHKSVSSDSNTSSYSSEIESGTEEEGFESASADLDDETREDSAILGGNNVYRPDGGDTGKETAEGSGSLSGLRVFRPFAGDPDEETSENYSSFDEEDIPNPRIVVPRAKLSMDDDEIDHILGSEGEDIGFAGLVKIPSAVSVARIKFSGVEGRKEEEGRSQELGETSFINKPEFSGLGLNESLSGEVETIDTDDSDHGSVLIESVEENDLNIQREVDLGSPVTVRSEGEFVKERLGLDKSVEECIEERPMRGNRFDGSENEFDAMVKPVERFVTIGSGEQEIIEWETKVCRNNDGGGVLDKTEKLGSKTEHGIDSEDSEISQLDPNRESLIVGSNEVDGTADVILSDILPGSMESVKPDPEVRLESEGEADQDSGKRGKSLLLSGDIFNSLNFGKIERIDEITKNEEQLSQQTTSEVALRYEREANQDSGKTQKSMHDDYKNLSLGRSAKTTDETRKNEEQISELLDGQVVSESEREGIQDSVKTGQSSLLSDEGVNNLSLGDSVEMIDETIKTQEQISGLIVNRVSVRFGVDEKVTRRGEEPSDRFAEPNGLEESPLEYFTGFLSVEEKERIEKMQLVRMKFLRLVQSLGLSFDDYVVAEVMDKLALALEGHKTFHGFGLESNETKAIELEEEGKHDLDISLNIFVLGKTGVGKSAVVNSIFGELKSVSGAFGPTTSFLKEIDGIVDGVKIRVLDTPGLRLSATEDRFNQRILSSIKNHMRKFPADVLLYIDRLDEHSGNFCDTHLLRTITSSLGSSIWKNAIVVLTHSTSCDLDLSHENFVAQRSLLMQRAICLAMEDSTLSNPGTMPKVILAENNEKSFQEYEIRECVFRNWRQQLMLFSYSVKILSEASSILRPESPIDSAKPFDYRVHSFSAFYRLWNLLNPQAYPRLSSSWKCDNFFLHNDLEEKKAYASGSQFEKLSKEENKAWLEGYELLTKTQLSDELKRSRKTKKNTKKRENDNLYEKNEADFAETRKLDGGNNEISLERNVDVGSTFRRARRGRKGFGIHLGSLGCEPELKTIFSVGRGSRMFVGVGLNKEREGQISVRMSGSEQLQILACGVLPMLVSLFRSVCGGCNKKNST